MSSVPTSVDDIDVDASEVEIVDLESEVEQSYIEYAMSVIVHRALPDVRDGLKPVQRRILYAMDQENIGSTGRHRKSSSIIGTTMGDYHPHGDKSIYDALVRMAQDFSLRVPLIDGQGNFGSIDGDPPAAMRYTEARMSGFGQTMLDDVDEQTTNYSDNYDGRKREPDVLTSAFPNLLINGSEGIAVGVSTKIPPHNPQEVIDAVIHQINTPDATVDELMEYIKGPDFPTGGQILGTDELEKAYRTGRGKITVRGKYHIEQDEDTTQVVITEIPFQDRNRKSDIVEDIAEMVADGKLEGVRDLRDESNEGIRIVIELQQNQIPEITANKVVSNVLEKTFGMIMLALVDGKPTVLSLPEILQEYIDHRRNVIRRRTERDLEEAENEAHILEGRLKALENTEDIVELIQESEDRSSARETMEQEYGFSETQSEHIVRMQLGSLTSMESEEITTQYDSVTDDIDRFETILSSQEELDKVVKKELREVKERFTTERLTEIHPDKSAESLSRKDFIANETQILAITEDNYVKRVSLDEITQYNRGGKGLRGINLRDGDNLKQVQLCNTHDKLRIVSDTGQIYSAEVFELPEKSRQSRGTPLVNVIDISKEENIAAIHTAEEIPDEGCLTFVTKNGLVKQTSITEYKNIYTSGIRGIKLDENDEVVDMFYCNSTDDTIMLTTQNGKSIRFEANDVSVTGRNTQGVNGIKLDEDDEVVAGDIVEEGDVLLTMTENGFGKFTKEEEHKVQSRYGKGIKMMNMCERNGSIVGVKSISKEKLDETELVLSVEDGRMFRTTCDDISIVGRVTKGVTVVETEDSKVSSVTASELL